ncbi:carboxylate--amine ligase/circularly permuted type 2 ATP-grasp protein [Microbacterium sp. 18062]|uniref:carboxylate--amine ligase/circularly permuted type 2 ATP-grasp protein n=1 Tax=Microbacterium sp. 18062 TaxID=2681410 RepID=UPI001F299F49|nr:carboxylate--amine ligase/circularly permuted type 2 ATP-grasp protein [Microbacterium sp. 18062]
MDNAPQQRVDLLPPGVELTLGAEEELHLIDVETRRLSARAPEILAKLPADQFTAEIQRTTVEFMTDPVSTLGGLRAQLLDRRRVLIEVAEAEGLAPAAVGTAPMADVDDFELTSTGRYARMQENYRLLVDQQLICGTQIHVGVSDRDLAVQIMQRVSRDLPVLCAMAASSPYLSGSDTGYSSIRSIIWQRWPSAGSTGRLESAAAYDELLADLIRSGVIADEAMAYFDVRPSSHAPTLELRVLDACPIVDDAVLIAGLFRAAVREAAREIAQGVTWAPLREPIHRAAMWQAARSGLTGDLLDDSDRPHPIPAAEAVRALVERLTPDLKALGDVEEVRHLAESLLTRGNSADRQRAAFAEHGSLEDVVDQVIADTRGPASGPVVDAPALRGYGVRAGDEAVGPATRSRPAYAKLFDHHRSLRAGGRAERLAAAANWTREAELTFRLEVGGDVDGEGEAFAVDLMPRIIAHHEWTAIERGLVQRARAIESFLRDVYSGQRIAHSGIITQDAIARTGAWRDEARMLPPDAVRAPIMGFDLVRDEFRGWRVLEDNVRSPSGIAYAIAARRLMDAVMPDAPRPEGLLDPESAIGMLGDTLRLGDPDGRVGLLSAGESSGAWFEHRLLAEEAGFPLLLPADVRVVDGRVTDAAGLPFDVLYLRLDGELADLVTDDGVAIGREILEVAEAGGIRIANAPGTGVADDKAMYCYVPEFIGFYLDERPLLDAVPTYRIADAAERRIVLERLGELVTKPVYGQGGRGVLIGPHATAAEVAERRAAIVSAPTDWIAQELVRLSRHPTWASAGGLEPRRVDLRVFAFVTGTGPGDVRLAPLGLTRFARASSMIVNSSAGGGAKDTWIIGERAGRRG